MRFQAMYSSGSHNRYSYMALTDGQCKDLFDSKRELKREGYDEFCAFA